MPKISIKEAGQILGVSADTLRRWEKDGKILPERTEGGHRRYDLAALMGLEQKSGLTVLYGRVSTRPQKKDLNRQVAVLEAYAQLHGWENTLTITDLGSGINYRKKGLNRLIGLLIDGKVRRLVLTHKDRLLRIGSDLILSICEMRSVEVVIINRNPDMSTEEELVGDVLEVVTVYAAKHHSQRARKNVDFLHKNLSKLADIADKESVK